MRRVDEELFDSLTKAIEYAAEGGEGSEVHVQSWRCISPNEQALAKDMKVKLVSVNNKGEPIEGKEPAAFSHLTDPICLQASDYFSALEHEHERLLMHPETIEMLTKLPAFRHFKVSRDYADTDVFSASPSLFDPIEEAKEVLQPPQGMRLRSR